MKKKTFVDELLNGLLIAVLGLLGVAFIAFSGGYGLILALVAFCIAAGVYKRNRWAYFASAAWALACYQLAKEGLALEELKRLVMVLLIPLVVLSIYLHESLGRQTRTNNDHQPSSKA